MAAITVDQLYTTIFETCYPVGSIFQTSVAGDPSTIIPGSQNSTWQQITDRMLIGAGNVYPVDSTGGEATVTLTVDQMPRHEHMIALNADPNYKVFRYRAGDPTITGQRASQDIGQSTLTGLYDIATSTGGSQPHNNVPPYYSIYIWKRLT